MVKQVKPITEKTIKTNQKPKINEIMLSDHDLIKAVMKNTRWRRFQQWVFGITMVFGVLSLTIVMILIF